MSPTHTYLALANLAISFYFTDNFYSLYVLSSNNIEEGLMNFFFHWFALKGNNKNECEIVKNNHVFILKAHYVIFRH